MRWGLRRCSRASKRTLQRAVCVASAVLSGNCVPCVETVRTGTITGALSHRRCNARRPLAGQAHSTARAKNATINPRANDLAPQNAQQIVRDVSVRAGLAYSLDMTNALGTPKVFASRQARVQRSPA